MELYANSILQNFNWNLSNLIKGILIFFLEFYVCLLEILFLFLWTKCLFYAFFFLSLGVFRESERFAHINWFKFYILSNFIYNIWIWVRIYSILFIMFYCFVFLILISVFTFMLLWHRINPAWLSCCLHIVCVAPSQYHQQSRRQHQNVLSMYFKQWPHPSLVYG